MPKRTDIKSILIIGAGPIVIGQACEFDYSGTQACKALRAEGYRIILINSNPATIMTDPDVADKTYIEPITLEIIEEIIKKEKPDAILPTMGGQTALNAAMLLKKEGVLEKYNVELIGANSEAIENAEDREKFKKNMIEVGLECARSAICRSLDEAKSALKIIGLPTIIRPSFTLGGSGGGIANTEAEYLKIVEHGLDLSPTHEVLIEESLLGWKEFEMEVVRDKNDNCIIVCSIENLDPMGIHTGDSITVAPALTLTDKEYQLMRDASFKCIRKIGVETGGSNVQFAINPKNGRMIIIEMNPRVSRSSALASKATGFPIAKVAARLAVGYSLDELKNEITETTPASFEPTIDYVVTKIPRFAFEKFKNAEPILGTAMKSVGEVMSIGRNFKESLQKALSSLEIGLHGLDPIDEISNEDLNKKIEERTPQKILYIAEAFRRNFSIDKIYELSKVDKWFLEQIVEIVEIEKDIKKGNVLKDKNVLAFIKSQGFTDKRIANLLKSTSEKVRDTRKKFKIHPIYKKIDTCAGEFNSKTPYMYSTYDHSDLKSCESDVSKNKKVIILGSGPNRIGQGVEFDYCCVQASYALNEIGIETIMVNCNPETVSTDYDTSDRLYFEPLSEEHVLEIVHKEQNKGKLLGVIVQFGGQTPLKLSKYLHKNKVPILGTQLWSIDLAEDREKFKNFLIKNKLLQADSGLARSEEQAITIAKKIGFPLVIRPSYVLGGRAMEIVYDNEQLKKYIKEAVRVSGDDPVLIDRFINNAIEVDVDAISDGKDVFIAGIMEHIEEAGIHSGDSACCIPPYSLPEKIIKKLTEQTKKIAFGLNVIGLVNIQYAIKDDQIYVLEVNPRASRTVPFVAKAIGLPVAKIATKIMAGFKLSKLKLNKKTHNLYSVKEAVFPFNKFPGVDTLLGPEMKSTGEVMGIDKTFGLAFAKSQFAIGNKIPKNGIAFISVKDGDKKYITKIAKDLKQLGFEILGTSGTEKFLNDAGVECKKVNKVLEGKPHIEDALNQKKIALVINTTEGKQSIVDSYSLRRAALTTNTPFYTTIAGANAICEAIKSIKSSKLEVKAIQDI
ncbi:MAG: carbamoyl-phosphate synthase large subunit [Pelagibacterales bacterium]|nr:carbamoyl-phosphate synthase large subunit [Pelagibacterales bacterium]